MRTQGASLSVETVDLAGAQARAAPWRELCARALEANVFAEPAFLVPAARLGGRVRFLFVWSEAARRRLVGVFAIEAPRFGFGGVARVWMSEQAGLAAFALDRDDAEVALEAAIDALARRRPRAAGLFIPALAADGPTLALLESLAARRALAIRRAGSRQRALLTAARAGESFADALPGRRLKEWRRLRRRLEGRSPLVFVQASAGEDLREAIERFLALEAKGWKGRAGAPLGADAARAAFARSLTAGLGGEGKLRVDRLDLAGRTIAAGIVLRAQDRAFYWKTAYDEDFAEFSPGVQLTLELSRLQERDPVLAATDSCAIENHPMIDRLWTQRLALVDCLVATRTGGGARLDRWLAARALAQRARNALKRVVLPLLGRKIS